jgi:hypothetical protein
MPFFSITANPFNTDSKQMSVGKRIEFVEVGNLQHGHGVLRHGSNEIRTVLSSGLVCVIYPFGDPYAQANGFASEGSGDSGGPGFIKDSLGMEVVFGDWRGGRHATESRRS